MRRGNHSEADANRLAEALDRLRREKLSLVVITRNGESHLSRERGVMPLVTLIDSLGDGLRGAVLADKVVGRAAALMAVPAGFVRVHALVMSEPARRVLAAHGIPATWDRLVPGIRNRNDDGPCPMEALTMEIEDPSKALKQIRRALGRG